jgi:hypothetical protein
MEVKMKSQQVTCHPLGILLSGFYPETVFLDVILRSKATKNLIVRGSAEILRGVYPEPVEGLRMT